jgi:hypothetical protein
VTTWNVSGLTLPCTFGWAYVVIANPNAVSVTLRAQNCSLPGTWPGTCASSSTCLTYHCDASQCLAFGTLCMLRHLCSLRFHEELRMPWWAWLIVGCAVAAALVVVGAIAYMCCGRKQTQSYEQIR